MGTAPSRKLNRILGLAFGNERALEGYPRDVRMACRIRRFGLAKAKRMEGCTHTGVFPGISVRDPDEEFRDTGFFPPICDVVHDVSCGFSEIE